MRWKIVPKNVTVSAEAIDKYNLAKKTCGNSLILEGASSKIRHIRSDLINMGYGITIVTTYSLLVDIIGSSKMSDIAESSKSIKPEDIISAAKQNKSIYSILEVA